MAATARVDHVPKCAKVAGRVKALADAGAAVTSIATALGIPLSLATDALRYAEEHGVVADPKPGDEAVCTRRPSKAEDLAAEVARLRDVKRLPFKTIAAKLEVDPSTVRQAYDLAHRDRVAAAAAEGRRPDRGRYTLIPMEKYREIEDRLRRGERVAAVAAAVGCGASTVYRVREALRNQPESASDG